MDLSVAFAVDLRRLCDTGDIDDADIAALLTALGAEARATIDSFAGITFVLMTDGHPIRFTAFEAGMTEADVVTSVMLPLAALAATEAGSMLIIYAARPGALVDLAADAAVALGITPDSVSLDRHLPGPGELSGPSGLADALVMNQAIGVLLDRGLLPATARLEVHRLAWMSAITLGEASSALIATAEHRDLGLVAGY